MKALLAFVLAVLALCLPGLALAQTGWQVRHFALQLEPVFETRTVRGEVTIDVTVDDSTLRHMDLDAGDLHINSVRWDSAALAFEKTAHRVRVFLPVGVPAGKTHQLQIRYDGKPAGGLRFDPDFQQVATAFSTSQWMPCLDDPSVRASFTLSLILPPELVSVGNGSQHETQGRVDGKTVHRWQLDVPIPSYLYGFAAGRFAQAQQTVGATRLQYVGAPPFNSQTLLQVFADSADMLAFYAGKAGVAYPLATYSQVLLNGPASQEMAGFSVMGIRYGARVLADPQAIWLGAHEMAHQWWGNGVTNRSWRHFWLNEGIATFMTAACLEHRLGPDAYAQQIDAARTKYTAIKEAGLDRSLVFPNWDAPTATDRSLVYDKGALVMHELRMLMGEERFWNALKHYTRTHWGQLVETADFQRAMEVSSAMDLGAFFRQWVY